MKLIVGLGNIGTEYETTRHNVGFMAIDYFCEVFNQKLIHKFDGLFCKFRLHDEDILFFKPGTYMNTSGAPLRKVMDFYKLQPEDIVIIYDDLDLPCGKIRARSKGSAGGHNGMRSIITHIHTENFKRLRIGIGRNPKIPVIKYVLTSFSKSEYQDILDALQKSSLLIDLLSQDISFPEIMTQLNTTS